MDPSTQAVWILSSGWIVSFALFALLARCLIQVSEGKDRIILELSREIRLLEIQRSDPLAGRLQSNAEVWKERAKVDDTVVRAIRANREREAEIRKAAERAGVRPRFRKVMVPADSAPSSPMPIVGRPAEPVTSDSGKESGDVVNPGASA